jgi:hypothetical protein
MYRKLGLLLFAALILGTLAFIAGCSDNTSDNTTVTPSIGVTSPATGANWTAGTVRTIRWTKESITSVDLAYTLDGGSSWAVISTGVTVDTFAWTVPDYPTTTAKIRVRSNADTTLFNASGLFTIARPPLVGSWYADQTQITDSLGLDSMRYVFALDLGYTATQWAAGTDIVESGTYVAHTDSIHFHETSYDGNPVDENYVRIYALSNHDSTMVTEVLGGTELYTITFRKR